MNWYRITPCPKYAISEDGNNVINIEGNKILHHDATPFAKDGKRRITLYYIKDFMGKSRAYKKAYTLDYLKSFIHPMNKVNIDETQIIW